MKILVVDGAPNNHSAIAQSKEAGFLEHLVKPIDVKALDAAIQRVVVNQR